MKCNLNYKLKNQASSRELNLRLKALFYNNSKKSSLVSPACLIIALKAPLEISL